MSDQPTPNAEQQKPRKFRGKITSKHDEILTRLNNCEFLTDIAKLIGVDRWYLSDYIKATEDLNKAYDDAQEKKADLCEKVILDVATTSSENITTENGNFPRNDGRIMTANFNAAKFWLERMAQRRGWGAKIETHETGNGRMPLIFLGNPTEEAIAEAQQKVAAANAEAGLAEED